MQKKVIWLFGLSGAGKSTIAQSIQRELNQQNIAHLLLDGDELRSSVNKDLGFSDQERTENIRRAAEIAKIISNQNIVCVCSFITPLLSLRNLVKDILKDNVELFFIDTPIEECIKRDVKGLYKKAQNNEINNFTGISGKFEYPSPEERVISISTVGKSPEECVVEILNKLK
ncbi:MAG: adenylyl-sulfate kinase [Bacteroidia bacterium]